MGNGECKIGSDAHPLKQTLNVTLEILVQEAIEEVESNEQSGKR